MMQIGRCSFPAAAFIVYIYKRHKKRRQKREEEGSFVTSSGKESSRHTESGRNVSVDLLPYASVLTLTLSQQRL